MRKNDLWRGAAAVAFAAACVQAVSTTLADAAAWQPSRTVTFVVPAGTGGGADQMAREVQGVTAKYKLLPRPMVVINESGGAGAQGFLDVKGAKSDPNKLIITLSNLFTTPLATGVPFSWKDFTPIAMLELDEFVLWVNADTPYKTAAEYIDAVKKTPNKFRMGGTGSKQEDQIITAAIEQKTGTKFIYVPYKGGGTVNEQLAGGHVDSTVNNPIEGIANWRAGKVRPLCVFDSARMQYPDKIVGDMSWADIPTCKEAGLDVQYLMLRGVFTSPDVSQDAVNYYADYFKKIRQTPDWQAFTKKAAFKQQFMSGAEFKDWLNKTAEMHKELMKKAGFLANAS
jgi:tripartite-type tricarboxylate transporter receptor subunit TctC